MASPEGNQCIYVVLLSVLSKENPSYAYVKIIATNEEEKDTEYMLVCTDLLTVWSCEFETCNEMMEFSSPEKYDGTDIINYIPKSVSIGFKKLYTQLSTGIYPTFDSFEEQIEYLIILCKLATREKISIILYRVINNISGDVLSYLISTKLIDAANCFDNNIKKMLNHTDISIDNNLSRHYTIHKWLQNKDNPFNTVFPKKIYRKPSTFFTKRKFMTEYVFPMIKSCIVPLYIDIRWTYTVPETEKVGIVKKLKKEALELAT